MARTVCSATRLPLALALGLMLALLSGRALAQEWQVSRMTDQRAPATVLNVHWSAAAGRPLQPRELRVGDKLADGGELRAAASTEIEFTRPNTVTITKARGEGGVLALDSRGRSVEVKGGNWGFKTPLAAMGKKLDPFGVKAGSAEARTIGTEFTVEMDPVACVVQFEVLEGAIQITVPVMAEVAGLAGTAGWTQRRILRAGDPPLRLPTAPAGVVKRFASLDSALTAFENDAREALSRQDTDARIDALIALGDLQLLGKRTQQARLSFEQALPLVGVTPDDAYWRQVLDERIQSAQMAQARLAEDLRRAAESMTPKGPDPSGLGALQGRLLALKDGLRPPGDYHLAKAQCWLDVARHEYLRNDRSAFVTVARAESEKLLSGMESGSSPSDANPQLPQAPRIRPDLWLSASVLKQPPGGRCAAERVACAEVRLLHAGHELAQQGWRHAQPYVQMAEDLLTEAAALARSCPDVPTVGAGATAPVPPAPSAPAAAVAAPATAPRVMQKLSYAADAFFDVGQAQLKPEGRARLSELAQKTRGVALETVVIVGHTDALGNPQANVRLSQRRAEAVKAFLVQQGMPVERFFTEGRGGRSPVADNRTAAGRAANRRVDVEVIGSGPAP